MESSKTHWDLAGTREALYVSRSAWKMYSLRFYLTPTAFLTHISFFLF